MTDKELHKGIALIGKSAFLKVSKDNILAYVQGSVKELYDEICRKLPEALKKNGIVYGIKEIPEFKNDNIMIVAQGRKPKHGEDGRIDIVASSWQETPEKKEGENTDYRNLNLIKNVSKGEVIARRVPPTSGKPGKDVFGREIPARPGQWKLFKLGERVELVDENTLIATDYGALHIEADGRISVKIQYQISGDVDWSTGHVEFYGKKLIITGSVLGGFTVECDGDVIIGKNIEDEAIVLSGGDLVVKGIIRSQNTMVKTGGNLICGMIEYARAFVGGDLHVGNYLLNANCQVQGSVEAIQGKGLIAGGKILVGGSVKANTLGTPANVPTLVGAGLDPVMLTHYKSHIKEQESLADKLRKIKEGLLKIHKLSQKKGTLDKKFQVLRERLENAALAIAEELHKNREKIDRLEENLGLMDQATITIFGTAYTNSILKIFEASVTLKQPMEKMLFFYKSGEVIGRSLN